MIKLKNGIRKYAIAFVLLFLCLAISLITDKFFTAKNLTNVLRQISINGILTIGMLFVILSGGIDLSVGSSLALSGVILAYLIKNGYSIGVSVMACLACACLVGLINGILVAKSKMAPFIVTMATNTMCRGFAYLVTDAKPIAIADSHFVLLSSTYFLGIPVPAWILFVMFAAGVLILDKTSFGRHLYAVGGNEVAANVSGVNTGKVKLLGYVFCGLMVGVAACISTARVTSGLCTAGSGFELDAIASAVIGGASLAGGTGSLWAGMIGALIIGVINNGMSLLGVNSYWQQIIKGLIIILAVRIDIANKK